MVDSTDDVCSIRKLEEIFWNGYMFVDKNRCKVKPEPILNPRLIKLGFGEELKKKKVEEFIKQCLPKTSAEYWEVNAYCKGISENNEMGTPIQFYKIK
jgi:hypothetical protein